MGKSRAQLDREIADVLSNGPYADRGDRVLADLKRWGVDREQIDEVRVAFRSGDHRRAMALAKDLGWNRAAKRGRSHSTVKTDDRYTAKQRASQAEIKLDQITTGQWSRDRVVAVLRDVDTEALREIARRHALGAGIFTAGRQVAKWAREVLDERGSNAHATIKGDAFTASIRLEGAPAPMQTRTFKHRAEAQTWLDQQREIADRRGWGGYRFELSELRAPKRGGRSSHATRRGAGVEVDTSVYRRYHGAEPRGFGDWAFVIGKREFEYSDDPALYRPAQARGAHKGGRPGLSFANAKTHAIAEAKRRGATIVGVAP